MTTKQPNLLKNYLTTFLGVLIIAIAMYFFYIAEIKTWAEYIQMIGMILIGYSFIQAWNDTLKSIQKKIFGLKNTNDNE